jgi:hypothetical protein
MLGCSHTLCTPCGCIDSGRGESAKVYIVVFSWEVRVLTLGIFSFLLELGSPDPRNLFEVPHAVVCELKSVGRVCTVTVRVV